MGEPSICRSSTLLVSPPPPHHHHCARNSISLMGLFIYTSWTPELRSRDSLEEGRLSWEEEGATNYDAVMATAAGGKVGRWKQIAAPGPRGGPSTAGRGRREGSVPWYY